MKLTISGFRPIAAHPALRALVTLLLVAVAVVATVLAATPAHAGPQLRGVDGRHGPLVGENFSPADHPTVIANWSGVRYTYGIPSKWSCAKGSSIFHSTGVMTCWDEKMSDGRGAGGAVGYQDCAHTCTAVDVERIGMQLRMDPRAWRVLDSTTWSAEQAGSMDGRPIVRVALRHTFTPAGSYIRNGIAYSQLTGPADKRGEMLKILNSIRANTPR